MDASKQYMKDNQILPRISFNDGSAHTVKLLKDKIDTIPDGKGGTVQGMKYLVEEDGETKSFFSGSVGLISKLSILEVGDVVTVQMKKANNKSFFVVTKDGSEVKADENDEEEIADDEEPAKNPGW